MDKRLKLLDRLKIELGGYLYVGNERKDGWKETTPFYLFKCEKHGLVKNYASGHNGKLVCPECLKELLEENSMIDITQKTMETIEI
jgi:hypothetical protein